MSRKIQTKYKESKAGSRTWPDLIRKRRLQARSVTNSIKSSAVKQELRNAQGLMVQWKWCGANTHSHTRTHRTARKSGPPSLVLFVFNWAISMECALVSTLNRFLRLETYNRTSLSSWCRYRCASEAKSTQIRIKSTWI